ncbi:MAG: ribonuclease H [Betaproteobacteria bacterium]|nr:ribonuclease H [Betaproteobacteria bacterium]
MTTIYLDIETIPAQKPELIELLRDEAETEKAAVAAPGNYKDPAKIQEYVAEKRAGIDAAFDERYRRTALDGAYGQIAVIGYAIDDLPPVTLYSDHWDKPHYEAGLLENFNEDLRSVYEKSDKTRPIFAGHNIRDFDLRFLFQRYAVNGVSPWPFIPLGHDARYGSYDTMLEWAGRGAFVSLDKLCRVFGLPGKSLVNGSLDGSKVWDFVKAGRILEVADYCKADVERAREIHRRMTFTACNQMAA